MTTVTLDENTVRRLEAEGAAVTIADSQGRLVGIFVPSEPSVSQSDRNPGVTGEELDRREKAGGGRTLDEIVADWHRNP